MALPEGTHIWNFVEGAGEDSGWNIGLYLILSQITHSSNSVQSALTGNASPGFQTGGTPGSSWTRLISYLEIPIIFMPCSVTWKKLQVPPGNIVRSSA